MLKKDKSTELFAKAQTLFPGGVNSPVRAFKSVEGTPLFIEKGDGCFIYDADGNKYIDFCCSWGPLILGHNNEKIRNNITKTIQNGTSFGAPTALENQLADLIISNHRFIEMMRFVSSGTEAVMSAIRLARGYTQRDLIIKFDGCYHGHSDGLLVNAGSGLATFGTSSSAGVPEAYASQTIVLPLNDKEALTAAFEKHKNKIACVIIEPIPANNGLLLQDKSYLEFLRKISKDNGTLLIFDEVISGFRVGFEGAAAYYSIAPDIMTFGKIIGGGLPVGAYAASKEIMHHISPVGKVYQAGTLSGNPVAMSAGIAQIEQCLEKGFYEDLEKKTNEFCAGITSHCAAKKYPVHLFHIGSIFWFAFTEKESIKSSSEIDPSSMSYFKKMFAILLVNGVYFGPSGYEVGFVSAAHSEEHLKQVSNVICDALDKVFGSYE